MNVHELFTALSQQKRSASVTVKNGKIHIGGKPLKVGKGDIEVEPETDVDASSDHSGGLS